MREDLKAVEIVHARGEKGLQLKRLHRLLRHRDLFLTAYSNLYSNQGALTPGTDPDDTIDGMSLRRIDRILRQLEQGTFQWKPVRRRYIEKRDGRKRPLGLPNWSDKLVQEAMRILLNAYYEPQFSRHSHGFRPGRGCHTALKEIVQEWQGVIWFIEGDIKGCFDHLDHEVLLDILGRDIKDTRFMKLLRDMLKAGYLEDWVYHPTYSGTPQGGIISPLLSNIYLNELDRFVEQQLMPRYNRDNPGGVRKVNPAYARLSYQINQARKRSDWTAVHELTKARNQLPSIKQEWDAYRRLRYVRYADDWLIGFTGPRHEAEAIKAQLRDFLREHLHLELSAEKTLITHAKSKPARFLGYDVKVALNNAKRTNGRRSVNGHPMLRMPDEVYRKWRDKVCHNGKPVHRTLLLDRSDYDIVRTYAAEFNGLGNYYIMALNVASRMGSLKYFWMASLVKTLAHKHKTTAKRILRKYKKKTRGGRSAITVQVPREGKDPLVATFGATPFHYQRFGTPVDGKEHNLLVSRTQLIDRVLAEACELCGSQDEVVVHHIRKLADLKRRYARRKERPVWVETMIGINRKTLVVCRACHQAIHNGEYDGPSFKHE